MDDSATYRIEWTFSKQTLLGIERTSLKKTFACKVFFLQLVSKQTCNKQAAAYMIKKPFCYEVISSVTCVVLFFFIQLLQVIFRSGSK